MCKTMAPTTVRTAQGRLLMWDVDGSEGWVDGRIQGYCRSIDNLPGKVVSAFGVTDGAHLTLIEV